ncbi:MAG TPA: hypothetical protein VFV67_19325 [Actinophytocola sp.]|uniref:hypothetical protein n=1 Tax=Actinophytocola sp. TaxID=1872138 RepID=UPI002DB7AB8B|nr:hypothetical protein [Actinophytocola sp.]HEU5472804.1 hypothetical protein [Actinophytocola sp.]
MTDLDESTLPPRRPLPDEVRDRMRVTVLAGGRPAHFRPNRTRRPLAVAASVIALMAGAAVAVQTVTGPDEITGDQPPPLDRATADANLDRCWRALADKQRTVPGRDTWMPVLMVANRGITVTAARAAGKPLFCETTGTTATVSDPNAVPHPIEDTGTAAMLVGSAGSVSGVVDPEWRQLALEVKTEGPGKPVALTGTVIKDGLFVGFAPMTLGRPTDRIRALREVPGRPSPEYPWQDLPAAPDPLVPNAVDAVPPPVDRTAEMAEVFDDCKRGSNGSLDWTGWEPVAIAGTAPNRTLLLRSGLRIMKCTIHPSSWDGYDGPGYTYGPWPHGTIAPAEPLSYVTWESVGPEQAVFGLLRSDVATMELIGPGGFPINVPIEGGYFTVTFPTFGIYGPELTVVLRNGSGTEVHRGPLPVMADTMTR